MSPFSWTRKNEDEEEEEEEEKDDDGAGGEDDDDDDNNEKMVETAFRGNSIPCFSSKETYRAATLQERSRAFPL